MILVERFSGLTAQINAKDLADVAGVSKYATLTDISKAYNETDEYGNHVGNTTAVRIVAEHLKSLYQFADADVSLDQFMDTATLIVSEYKWLNIHEISVFFRRCKLGKYGQMIWGSRLNTQQIMIALKEFHKERADVINKRESELLKLKREEEKKHSITRSQHEERTKKAQKDIEEFKKIYPVIPTDKPIQEYWELWEKKDSETIDYLYKCNRK